GRAPSPNRFSALNLASMVRAVRWSSSVPASMGSDARAAACVKWAARLQAGNAVGFRARPGQTARRAASRAIASHLASRRAGARSAPRLEDQIERRLGRAPEVREPGLAEDLGEPRLPRLRAQDEVPPPAGRVSGASSAHAHVEARGAAHPLPAAG